MITVKRAGSAHWASRVSKLVEDPGHQYNPIDQFKYGKCGPYQRHRYWKNPCPTCERKLPIVCLRCGQVPPKYIYANPRRNEKNRHYRERNAERAKLISAKSYAKKKGDYVMMEWIQKKIDRLPLAVCEKCGRSMRKCARKPCK